MDQDQMRSADEIQNLIIDKATTDTRIRAVFLNGSRANDNVLPDKYQDFDVVFLVTDIDSFVSDSNWVNFFGDKIIQQLPDKMRSAEEDVKDNYAFHYLMLFRDGNRIDLTLRRLDKIEKDLLFDSLTIVWLDKDNLFSNIEKPNNKDYLIKNPSEKEFVDTCNEFWWVCTYVSKGLLRNQLTFAKEMLETVVRPMFMKVIEWKIGTSTNFLVSFGKGGKFMNRYLSSTEYNNILATYSDQQIKNNWTSLFLMTELFGQFAKTVAETLNFQYNLDEEQNVKEYLRQSFTEQE